MKKMLQRWDSNRDLGGHSSNSSSSGSSSSSSSSSSRSYSSGSDSYNDNGRKRAKHGQDLDSDEHKFASFIEAAANIVNRTTVVPVTSSENT